MSTAKKIALITGANKGIGFEVATQIAKVGVTVLLGARNKALGDAAAAKLKADGLDVQFLHIDATDNASITAAATSIESQFGKLDILINNAGIIDHVDGPPSTANLDAVERTLRTNFLGPIAIVQAMLPLLHKAPAANVVNVSSGLGSLTQNGDLNYFGAFAKFIGYNSSKAALNMLTVQLAYELRETKIKVNSADPGYTATDLNDNRGTQTIAEGSEEIIRLALINEDGPSGTYSDRNGIVPW
jgi:NAD(P)-dependent dehydrogenase (short-subunit alcohol dehydrogenase family)